jgi:hypothetical protein
MKSLKLLLGLFFILSLFAVEAQTVQPKNNYEQGVELMTMKKFDEAIVKFSLSIEEKTEDLAAAYYFRAFSYCQVNNTEAACLDLHQASKLGHYVEKVAIPCGCDAKDPK